MKQGTPLARLRVPLSRKSEDPLRVTADFESGSIGTAAVIGPGHLGFTACAGGSPKPLWFHFCLEDAGPPTVRCDLLNADACLGPRHGWHTARPVYSPDGVSWRRAEHARYVEETDSSGYFTFSVPIVGPRTCVAYCYPYTTADLYRTLRGLGCPPDDERFLLVRSQEGRAVPYLRLGGQAGARRSVWILARQHAGETPASFAVQGMAELLFRAGPEALPCLRDTVFHLLPMLDVDGVYHGRYGKDRPPVDFNRDWTGSPSRPETAAAVTAMRRSHEEAPIALILDLHAPHHGDTSCYFFGQPVGDAGVLSAQQRLVAAVAREDAGNVGIGETDLRPADAPAGSARDRLHRLFGVPVLTVELSYHLAQTGSYLTPSRYRKLGEALVRGIDRCLG